MDTGFLKVANIWFQCVMPMPPAVGPMTTWPMFSALPSSQHSATVTRRDNSCKDMERKLAILHYTQVRFLELDTVPILHTNL